MNTLAVVFVALAALATAQAGAIIGAPALLGRGALLAGPSGVVNTGLVAPGVIGSGLIAPGLVAPGLVAPGLGLGLGLGRVAVAAPATTLITPSASTVISKPLLGGAIIGAPGVVGVNTLGLGLTHGW